MKEFRLCIIDGRLAIDFDTTYENMRCRGYTGLPERFDAADMAMAQTLGTVFLTKEKTSLIEAQYVGGGECAWCGEIRTALRHPHIYDLDPNGGKMCRICGDHDREVYKGSYGDDIGPFSSDEGNI